MKIRSLAPIAIALVPAQLALASGGAGPAPTLFAWDETEGQLWSVDADVPSASPIAPSTGLEVIAEIEFKDGMIYASTPADALRMFDAATGDLLSTTPFVFPPEGNAITGLEFVDGTLFGALTTGGGGETFLCTVNTADGVVTVVGTTGISTLPFGGLAYDGIKLYGVTAGGNNARLFTIDITTGTATEIGPVMNGGEGVRMTGLEFGEDGTLYGLGRFPNNNVLFNIDPATAIASSLGVPAGVDNDNQEFSAITSTRSDAATAPGDLAFTGSSLENPIFWGATGGVAGYSLGGTVCNIGQAPIAFNGPAGDNPVLVQNLYIDDNGVLKHIGQSYAHHPLGILSEGACDSDVSDGFFSLAPGRSARFDSAIAGLQSDLGPRSDLDPTTGAFSSPFSQDGESGTPPFKRVQADAATDFMSADASYGEVQILSADEIAQGGDPLNNVAATSLTPNGPTLMANGMNPGSAIELWETNNPADVSIATVNPGDDDDADGRIIGASRVIDNGNDTWTYVYAIYNQNSARAISSIIVPKPMPTAVSDSEMFFPTRHSGEEATHQNTDWSTLGGSDTDTFIRFTTDTFSTDPTSNRIGWGTTYTFTFTCNAPPAGLGEVLLDSWDSAGGDDGRLALMLEVPSDMVPNSGPCGAANFDTTNPAINFNDLVAFLTAYAAATGGDTLAIRRVNLATAGNGASDGNGFPNVCDPDYTIDFNDITAYLVAFTADLDCGIPCNLADLAPPFGMIDMDDQTVYFDAFGMHAMMPDDGSFEFDLADMDCDGDVDNDDATMFNDLFTAGCGN